MRKLNLLLALSLMSIFAFTAVGQAEPDRQNFDAPSNDRGNLIARALGLSEEQKLQIREINRRQRQLLRVAQLRLQTARAAADLAIYDDVLDESAVELRVREVAMAQAEITKIRMMSEVAVRNALSPEQLVKFRALRERFANQRRRANQKRNLRQRRQDGVNRRIRNREQQQDN